MSAGAAAPATRKRSRSRSVSPPAQKTRTEPVGVALFLYRRDLRLNDNTALLQLCDRAALLKLKVVPAFFFNPQQEDKSKNPYCGDACLHFMYASLQDLSTQLDGRLVCLEGSDAECLAQLTSCGLVPRVLGYNEDFTPFAMQRDERLSAWCESKGADVVSSDADYSLLPLGTVTNQQDLPYSVFTAFYNTFMAQHASAVPAVRAWDRDVQKVFLDAKQVAPRLGRYCVSLEERRNRMASASAQMLSEHGGRDAALQLLAKVSTLKNYQQERDVMIPDRTSHLSPHLKFGTVSSREVWEKAVQGLGRTHPFVRQLIWREFYAVLLCHHPRLAQGQLNAFARPKASPLVNAPFQAKYDRYQWKWDPKHFEAFKAGMTGVPLVDAAVRCVTQTGWCHNRCRMVIANFLVKTLSVDWREGEKWFATVAVDYDVANNSGGWLWSSGQGADAQPYFRTFNPFRQSERFDPDARYIRQWVPELRDVPAAVIHDWENYCRSHKRTPNQRALATTGNSSNSGSLNAKPQKAGVTKKDLMKLVYPTSYPNPIVDIRSCTQKVIDEFKKYDPK